MKQQSRTDFDEKYYFEKCWKKFLAKTLKWKKLLGQNKNFSLRLPCANETIREIHFSMMNTKYKTIEDIRNDLRCIKCGTKLYFNQKLGDDDEPINFMRQSKTLHFEKRFSKVVQSIAFILNEALFDMKFLQTKRQVKITIINYYDLCHTIILKLSEDGDWGGYWDLRLIS